LSGRCPVIYLCKLAKVAKSGYYKWLKNLSKAKSLRNIQNDLIESEILKVHQQYRGIYGLKRLHIHLNKIFNFRINHKRVYRLMKKLEIKSVIRKKRYNRKFKPSIIADNILNRNFKAEKPLEKLSMDITYIPLNSGGRRFIYLSAVKDLFNDEIVAYEIGLSNNMELVFKTLGKLNKLKLSKDCILHTDQGYQYTHKSYANLLIKNGIVQSMSRRGNCWDNIPIEIFFGHLKSELINLISYKSKEELIKVIEEYIDFYNNERVLLKHSMSPIEYKIRSA
jgi:putative transposase